VNIVIFSKNRAAQLEALLRSFYENCEDDLSQHKISVIFAFDGDMWQGYRKLQFSLKKKKNIKCTSGYFYQGTRVPLNATPAGALA
jgi:hypothetical protein